jgi:hypothetical protein
LLPARCSAQLGEENKAQPKCAGFCALTNRFRSRHMRVLRWGLRKSQTLESVDKQALSPSRRRGREAEGGGLLNRYTGLNPYRGFESLRLRHLFEKYYESAGRRGGRRPCNRLRGCRFYAIWHLIGTRVVPGQFSPMRNKASIDSAAPSSPRSNRCA